MATWGSRGLRGSTLEELVNQTNDHYRKNKQALIQKIPTPITPVQMEQDSNRITLAYFEKQSTVDYIGAVQGYPVCFDAKECKTDTFPLANVHEHQMQFMKEFQEMEGIAFFLIYFSERNVFYYMPYREMRKFFERMEAGGRKSFRYDELDPNWIIPVMEGWKILYLKLLKMDVDILVKLSVDKSE